MSDGVTRMLVRYQNEYAAALSSGDEQACIAVLEKMKAEIAAAIKDLRTEPRQCALSSCGKEFRPRRTDQIYCSSKCSNVFRVRRYRAQRSNEEQNSGLISFAE